MTGPEAFGLEDKTIFYDEHIIGKYMDRLGNGDYFIAKDLILENAIPLLQIRRLGSAEVGIHGFQLSNSGTPK